MSQLLTFISNKKEVTLQDASKILNVDINFLDTNFGVVEIDPTIHEYCVLYNKIDPIHPKGFKNVRIEPFNLEEE